MPILSREKMPALGVQELVIILVIIVILFGSTKLPELARSIGRAKKEFKEGMNEGGAEAEKKKRKKEQA